MSKLYKYNNPDITTAEADMKHYGISKSTVDYFHYKQFRYTTLADAVNQAKRDAPSQDSPGTL
jgi:hypothetical protein